MYVELNEGVEAATNSYYATGDFLQYAYSLLVAKNHNKMRSRCLVHEFFFFSQILFNDIKHGYRAAILKSFICGCVYFIWLWLLIAIMKRCAERCALQMSLISLTVNNRTTPVDNILESLLLTLCLFGNVTLIFC